MQLELNLQKKNLIIWIEHFNNRKGAVIVIVNVVSPSHKVSRYISHLTFINMNPEEESQLKKFWRSFVVLESKPKLLMKKMEPRHLVIPYV